MLAIRSRESIPRYYIIAPSWVSTSKSMFLKSQKAFLLALDPLRQISADLSKAKDVLALIQDNNNNNNNNNNRI